MKTRSGSTYDFEVKNLEVTGTLRDFQRKAKRVIASYLFQAITQIQLNHNKPILLDCEGGLDPEGEEFTMTIKLRSKSS